MGGGMPFSVRRFGPLARFQSARFSLMVMFWQFTGFSRKVGCQVLRKYFAQPQPAQAGHARLVLSKTVAFFLLNPVGVKFAAPLKWARRSEVSVWPESDRKSGQSSKTSEWQFNSRTNMPKTLQLKHLCFQLIQGYLPKLTFGGILRIYCLLNRHPACACHGSLIKLIDSC